MNVIRKSIYRCCLLLIVVTLAGCERPIEKMDPLAIDDITKVNPEYVRTNGAVYQVGYDDNLYGSSRAHRVGDLLTVHLVEDTTATDNISSKTSRTSTLKDSMSISPDITSGGIDISGNNQFNGSGTSNQSNKIRGDITVTVIKVLPGERLVVKGYKTITLSYGVEKVGISGVVREEDINTADNSVNSSQVADAHIAYLNQGDLKTSAHKGWLSKFFSGALWPV